MNSNQNNQQDQFSTLTEEQQQLVLQFSSIVNTDNVEIATSYLQMSNFDLNQAIALFLENEGVQQQNHQNYEQQQQQQVQQQQQQQQQYNYDDNYDEHYNYYEQQQQQQQQQQINVNNYEQNNSQTSNNPIVNEYIKFKKEKQAENNTGYVTKIFGFLKNSIKGIFHFTTKGYFNEVPSGQQFINFFTEQNGKFKTLNFSTGNFAYCLDQSKQSKKPLLLYIHLDNQGIKDLCINLLKNQNLINFINQNFVVLGINAQHDETRQFQESIKSSNYPCFAIFRKTLFEQPDLIQTIPIKSSNQDSEFYLDHLQSSFNNYLFLRNEEDSIEHEANTILQSQQQRQQNQPENQWNPFLTEYQQMIQQQIIRNQNQPQRPTKQQQERINQERLIRQQQEEQFREAQRQEEEQRRAKQIEEERIKKEEEENQIKLQQQQLLNEQKKQEKLKSIPQEPSAKEQNIITIQFRLPNGKRINRRFLQDDKIQLLFFYIETNDQFELEEGGDSSKFELVQTYPPLNLNDKQDKTIREIFQESVQETLYVKESY